MKKPEKEVRQKMIVVRMNKAEFEKLESLQKQSLEKSLSNYLRKVALQKPVIITYRNLSADAFLQEMILLRKELSAIGNNFNQAVKKLHILEKIPEFRTWLLLYDRQKDEIANKLGDIFKKMNTVYEQWLQK
jgi:hypothetical protein